MINFIRAKNITSPIGLFSSNNEPLWIDDAYLKPGEYESWLTYDFEQLNVDNDNITEDYKLIRMVQELTAKLVEKDKLLALASNDIETMKASFQHLLSKDQSSASKMTVDDSTMKKKRIENGVASVSLDEDNGYFESYSHFGIHHSMLSDKVRTESYRDAILNNASVMKDKIVMDLGCGTSILSLFASKAGAKTVYAVDQSEIIYQAMEIAQTNKVDNIKFVKGRLEDVEFPVKKVDVIISEWMGYFLLFEGMLDSVIFARDNYLAENGLLLPNRCTISLIGYGHDERYKGYIDFFDDVYSFDMKCMKKDILKEAHVERCSEEYVLTKPNILSDLNLMKVDLNCPNFSYDFQLEVIKDGNMSSFVGYFDTFFDLPEKVSFSTSPQAPPTHWQQVVFYLDKSYALKAGDSITGKFICQRDRKDLRSLKVEIRAFEKWFKYDLN